MHPDSKKKKKPNRKQYFPLFMAKKKYAVQ